MKKALSCLLVILLCAGIVIPAMAANVFLFTEKSVQLFEGETLQATVRREGNYAGDGEVVFASRKANVASVSEDGTITASNVTVNANTATEARAVALKPLSVSAVSAQGVLQ